MPEEKLLNILCEWLYDKKERLECAIAQDKERLSREPNLIHLDKDIAEKERCLGMNSENAMAKYQEFWRSLSPQDSYPCPFCFVIHNKISNLKAMPEDNGEESVKCRDCGNQIYFPSGTCG